MTDLTLQERQDIQTLLESYKAQLIKNYRNHAATKPPALASFAKDLLQCELSLQFNAVALQQAKGKISMPTTALTLQERLDIQDLLQAHKEQFVASYSQYAPSQPPALPKFARDVLECEQLLKFNAAEIKKLQKPPLLPRLRGH